MSFGLIENKQLILPYNPAIKEILEDLLLPHKMRDQKIIIAQYYSLLGCIGLKENLKKTRHMAGTS
jgi:hypothetical protein